MHCEWAHFASPFSKHEKLKSSLHSNDFHSLAVIPKRFRPELWTSVRHSTERFLCSAWSLLPLLEAHGCVLVGDLIIAELSFSMNSLARSEWVPQMSINCFQDFV